MKLLLSSLLLIISVLGMKAQSVERTCHFGITFEISNNPNWGYGEPVILSVESNSPAKRAGIQPGDIIMEINGAATYLRNYQTIASWLFNSDSDYSILTIRNLNTYFKEYELPRQCRSINSIGEYELATSFSMYSIEDTQERSFTLPLKIAANKDVDYTDYHTFSFMETSGAPDVDSYINAEIERALLEKGLVLDNENPDILVQTDYSYQPNPKLRNSTNKKTWRYDPITEKMVLLPIFSGDDSNAEQEGSIELHFSIRFYEQKLIDPENPTLIWEANVREYLSNDSYSLEDYIRTHASLIMMQFPYSVDKTFARYTVSFKKYNYTGLNYNFDDLKTITEVDPNSPAYNAGIKPGAIIEKIDGSKFNFTKDDVMEGYKRFIVETMKLRNPATQFTDANGYPNAMYWKHDKYGDVRKAFKKGIYAATMQYLYNFNAYVSQSNSSNSIIIEAKIDGKSKKFTIKPEIKKSIAVKAF
ncbi:PDZ domain-containing protein [Dysgonomonas sp. 216]|uniref:PDZ domain-containing protein n=1 Tax=Dysgonomonas sp. 216 TaxID=2302934 RepID=UPI0013D1005D|nr:PDZ domain-containing protein [Dysgonomonas sp. 216]NDW17624.1 PDZ domain-containing protein [Dysgonomonas sp. 216]